MHKFSHRFLLFLLSLMAMVNVTAGDVRAWRADVTTGAVDSFKVDTSLIGVEHWTPITSFSIANAWNGTWGSPVQSKIWNAASFSNDFLFAHPYEAYYMAAEGMGFYNTKTPFAELSYRTFGGSQTNTGDFSALFTVNANRHLNIGGVVEYMRARGMYSEQATRQVRAGGWGSFNSKWYDASLRYMYQQFDNEENGGLTDDAYLTSDSLRPEDPSRMPINLSNCAQSRFKDRYFWLNHRVHLAVKSVKLDSAHVEYKPIASLWHTMKWQQAEKRYREDYADTTFYANTYSVYNVTLDSATQETFSNAVGIQMDEGWSRWVPFSLTAYARHEYRSYGMEMDSVFRYAHGVDHHNTLMGAELAKRSGRNLNFLFAGELNTTGEYAGDWWTKGTFTTKFHLWNDSLSFGANVYASNQTPSYFLREYAGSYQQWSNDFAREGRLRIGAAASWRNRYVDLSARGFFETIHDLVYFGTNALPVQSSSDVQVTQVASDINFQLGIFHLDNSVVYQHTSNKEVLPLPDFSSYNNFYVLFRMFKRVLRTQIGAELEYHTAYYAPAYMPSTGMFYNQTDVKVGNYPLVSGYLAFHLYSARFFVKYYHVNADWGDHTYFAMAHYPLYRGRLHAGLVWNFYD